MIMTPTQKAQVQTSKVSRFKKYRVETNGQTDGRTLLPG